jgi:hypothetical protein
MSGEIAPWLWLIAVAVGAALLGLGLAYGTLMWRARRSRAVNQVREEVTERLYERGAQQERERERIGQ